MAAPLASEFQAAEITRRKIDVAVRDRACQIFRAAPISMPATHCCSRAKTLTADYFPPIHSLRVAGPRLAKLSAAS
jgi:hypothetical protein